MKNIRYSLVATLLTVSAFWIGCAQDSFDVRVVDRPRNLDEIPQSKTTPEPTDTAGTGTPDQTTPAPGPETISPGLGKPAAAGKPPIVSTEIVESPESQQWTQAFIATDSQLKAKAQEFYAQFKKLNVSNEDFKKALDALLALKTTHGPLLTSDEALPQLLDLMNSEKTAYTAADIIAWTQLVGKNQDELFLTAELQRLATKKVDIKNYSGLVEKLKSFTTAAKAQEIGLSSDQISQQINELRKTADIEPQAFGKNKVNVVKKDGSTYFKDQSAIDALTSLINLSSDMKTLETRRENFVKALRIVHGVHVMIDPQQIVPYFTKVEAMTFASLFGNDEKVLRLVLMNKNEIQRYKDQFKDQDLFKALDLRLAYLNERLGRHIDPASIGAKMKLKQELQRNADVVELNIY